MPKSADKSPSQRQLRVGEEIRHLLAGIFIRGELRDPALHDRAVTVTEVRISPDLKNATAFVVPLGGENSADIMTALRRCAPYLRTLVGHEMGLRYTPNLSFELDLSFDRAQRIEALLHSPAVQRDLQPHEDDTESEES